MICDEVTHLHTSHVHIYTLTYNNKNVYEVGIKPAIAFSDLFLNTATFCPEDFEIPQENTQI